MSIPTFEANPNAEIGPMPTAKLDPIYKPVLAREFEGPAVETSFKDRDPEMLNYLVRDYGKFAVGSQASSDINLGSL